MQIHPNACLPLLWSYGSGGMLLPLRSSLLQLLREVRDVLASSGGGSGSLCGRGLRCEGTALCVLRQLHQGVGG